MGPSKSLHASTKYQRWAVPSTKEPQYFFGTVTGTDGIFQKWYRSTCTAVLFKKSIWYFQFFDITYRLKIKLSLSFSFWIRANKFLTPKYIVTVHSKEGSRIACQQLMCNCNLSASAVWYHL